MKALLICYAIGNLQAIQILCRHTNNENAVQNLGDDDALTLACRNKSEQHDSLSWRGVAADSAELRSLSTQIVIPWNGGNVGVC